MIAAETDYTHHTAEVVPKDLDLVLGNTVYLALIGKLMRLVVITRGRVNYESVTDDGLFHHHNILLKSISYKQQTQAVTKLDKQGSKGALTAAYRHKNKKPI